MLYFSTSGQPPGYGFPFGNRNLAGSILGFGCCLAVVMCYQSWKKRYRHHYLFYGTIYCILLVIVILAKPKGALLALFLSFIWVSLWLWPLARRVTIILLPLLFTTFILWGTTALSYLQTLPSVEIRILLWQGTINLILDSPLRIFLGWGIGNFFPVYPNFQNPLANHCLFLC